LIPALSTWFLAPIASAQTQTPAKTTSPEPKDLDSDEGWHVGFTPYIWFAGIHGTVGALNHDASVHATFGDIFNYLNIGLMGVVEPRYNRIVMPVDFMWMKLSDNKALPFDVGGDAGGGSAKLDYQVAGIIAPVAGPASSTTLLCQVSVWA
jgi:hypothetical protein